MLAVSAIVETNEHSFLNMLHLQPARPKAFAPRERPRAVTVGRAFQASRSCWPKIAKGMPAEIRQNHLFCGNFSVERVRLSSNRDRLRHDLISGGRTPPRDRM